MKFINFFLFFLILFFVVTPKPILAKENGQFILKAPLSQIMVNDIISLEIYTNTSVPVNAAQTTITFPKDVFQVISIGTQTSTYNIKAKETMNEGVIELARGSTAPLTGQNLFAVLQVKALKNGQVSQFKALEPKTLIMTSKDNLNIYTNTQIDAPGTIDKPSNNNKIGFFEVIKEFFRKIFGV